MEDISLTAQNSAWEVLNMVPTPTLVTFYPMSLDQAVTAYLEHRSRDEATVIHLGWHDDYSEGQK